MSETKNENRAQSEQELLLNKIIEDDKNIRIKMNKGIVKAVNRLVEKEEFLSTDQFVETACHEFLIRHNIEIWGQPCS